MYRVYFFSQCKVALRDLVSGVVSGEAEVDVAVADIDVRMVVGGLGQPADFHHKGQSINEIGPADGAGKRVIGLGPTRGRNGGHAHTLRRLHRRARASGENCDGRDELQIL